MEKETQYEHVHELQVLTCREDLSVEQFEQYVLDRARKIFLDRGNISAILIMQTKKNLSTGQIKEGITYHLFFQVKTNTDLSEDSRRALSNMLHDLEVEAYAFVCECLRVSKVDPEKTPEHLILVHVESKDPWDYTTYTALDRNGELGPWEGGGGEGFLVGLLAVDMRKGGDSTVVRELVPASREQMN